MEDISNSLRLENYSLPLLNFSTASSLASFAALSSSSLSASYLSAFSNRMSVERSHSEDIEREKERAKQKLEENENLERELALRRIVASVEAQQAENKDNLGVDVEMADVGDDTIDTNSHSKNAASFGKASGSNHMEEKEVEEKVEFAFCKKSILNSRVFPSVTSLSSTKACHTCQREGQLLYCVFTHSFFFPLLSRLSSLTF